MELAKVLGLAGALALANSLGVAISVILAKALGLMIDVKLASALVLGLELADDEIDENVEGVGINTTSIISLADTDADADTDTESVSILESCEETLAEFVTIPVLDIVPVAEGITVLVTNLVL